MNNRPRSLLCRYRYFFIDDDVVVLAHRELALFKGRNVPIDALHMQVVEIFKASEPAKSLSAFADFEIGIKRVEGLTVFIIETDAIVLNFKVANLSETAIH